MMNIKIFKKNFILLLVSITFFNPALAIDWYKVNELPEVERINVEKTKALFYKSSTNTYSSVVSKKSDYPNIYQKGKRFYMFCNTEIDKCGLYDTKKDEFTGYKYYYKMKVDSENISLIHDCENEINMDSFSEIPFVVENYKKKKLQPIKRVIISTPKAVGYGLGYGSLFIIFSPILLPNPFFWSTLYLIPGYDKVSSGCGGYLRSQRKLLKDSKKQIKD